MYTRAQKKIFLIVLKGMGFHKDVCEGIYRYLNENDLFILAHAIGFQHKLGKILHNNNIDFIHEDNTAFFPDKFGVYCARNGYGKLLEYYDLGELYYNSSSSYYSDEKNNPFIAALKNKHYEIAKRLYKRDKVSFGSGESTAIGKIKDIGTFKFFIKVYKPTDKWLKRYVSEGAASKGLIDNLKHLKTLGWKFDKSLLLAEAAAHSQKNIFEWIVKEIMKAQNDDEKGELPYGTDTLCRHLAYDNNIEMLRYIHSRCYTIGDEIMFCAEIPEIIAFGIELGMELDIQDYIVYGKIKILKYLEENGYNVPMSINTFVAAVNSLNYEFVQWLMEKKCPSPHNISIDFDSLSHSDRKHISTQFVSLILSLYPKCEWRNIQYVKDLEILKMLNTAGVPFSMKVFSFNITNFEIVKWGLTQYPHLFSADLMEYAPLDVLQWLDKTFPNNRTAKTSYIAAIRNQFKYVKWLHYRAFPFDFPELYRSLYLNEDTSIFKWLYTIHPLPKSILLSYEPTQDHYHRYLNRTETYAIKSWIEKLPN